MVRETGEFCLFLDLISVWPMDGSRGALRGRFNVHACGKNFLAGIIYFILFFPLKAPKESETHWNCVLTSFTPLCIRLLLRHGATRTPKLFDRRRAMATAFARRPKQLRRAQGRLRKGSEGLKASEASDSGSSNKPTKERPRNMVEIH